MPGSLAHDRRDEASPAVGGGGDSAPSRSCHREERRGGPGLQLRSPASTFIARRRERADVSVLGAEPLPPPPPPVPC